MDFGLARAEAGRSSATHSSLPRGAGTRAYMAPEQLEGGVSNPSSDQYAFCVSLKAALWDKQLEIDPGDEVLRHRLARIIRRGRHPDPTQRYPSMQDLVGALRRELEHSGTHQATTEQARETKPVARSAKRRIRVERDLTLGLLCLLATGLLFLLYTAPSTWSSVLIPSLAALMAGRDWFTPH